MITKLDGEWVPILSRVDLKMIQVVVTNQTWKVVNNFKKLLLKKKKLSHLIGSTLKQKRRVI